MRHQHFDAASKSYVYGQCTKSIHIHLQLTFLLIKCNEYSSAYSKSLLKKWELWPKLKEEISLANRQGNRYSCNRVCKFSSIVNQTNSNTLFFSCNRDFVYRERTGPKSIRIKQPRNSNLTSQTLKISKKDITYKPSAIAMHMLDQLNENTTMFIVLVPFFPH